MRPNIPVHLQQAWDLFNSTEASLTYLWETYQDDFLEYYFPEVTGEPPEPPPTDIFLTDDDDIPF